jgi:hypothetical protein
MALVIIMMSAMPRLCGVNIYLRKDQRSLASRIAGVKAKVHTYESLDSWPLMADNKANPDASFFCILPYNCLAAAALGG